MITVATATPGCEHEALRAPFSFKGHSLTELWQSAVLLHDTAGHVGVGVATQSVLWSAPVVFLAHGERAGNRLMLALTAEALRRCIGRSFTEPSELLASLLPEMLDYARELVGVVDLRPTFVLNALVPIDHAAWQLYAATHGIAVVDRLLGSHPALTARHARIAGTPVIAYGDSVAQALELASNGTPLLKIKLGYNPAGDSDREKMLAWDCARLSQLHHTLLPLEVPSTDTGRIAYYLDANGRYDHPDRLNRLLDHCKKIGMLPQIVLLEEPFDEATDFDVSQFPVCIAADESAHSVADVHARFEAGYRAIALKPAAKSFSLSLQMAAAARAREMSVFCADLTANPVLVDWAKTLAARLPSLPGLQIGIMETNGPQNYSDWNRLLSYLTAPAAEWNLPANGLFTLSGTFFESWGGIFAPNAHYAGIASRGPG